MGTNWGTNIGEGENLKNGRKWVIFFMVWDERYYGAGLCRKMYKKCKISPINLVTLAIANIQPIQYIFIYDIMLILCHRQLIVFILVYRIKLVSTVIKFLTVI